MRCGGGLLGRMIIECKCLSGGVFTSNRCWSYTLMQLLAGIFNAGCVDFSFTRHLQKTMMVEDSASRVTGVAVCQCSRLIQVNFPIPFWNQRVMPSFNAMPTAVGILLSVSGSPVYAIAGSPSPPASAAPYPAGLSSWPLPRAPYVSGPRVQGPPAYMPVILSPQQSLLSMAKGAGFSKVVIQDAVKLKEESPIDEMKRLQNLNIFLYEEIMRLRTKNKFLLEKMDWIGFIVKNNRKARKKVICKSQEKSLWKCLNTPLVSGVPKEEVRIQQKVKLQQEDHIEREYADLYTPPQIEVIT
eukprot:Gb_28854 [translate_table: standard]